MKICPKCGTQNDDSSVFCHECGTPLSQEGTFNGENGYQTQYNTQNGGYYQNGQPNPHHDHGGYMGIEPRNIALCVIFSLITCGIYAIYWMIKINDEVNILSGEPDATSGVIVFLLTFVTCGIYGLYWLYKMGERCDRIKRIQGNSNILYLILGLVGFSIISYCLIQDTINKAV